MIRLPPLWATLVLAFLLRLVWALLIGVDPVSDSAAYDTFARNIAFQGTYGFVVDDPGAYWAVGTAAIYAGVYLVFGTGDWGIIAVNMVSQMLAVWGLYDLGRRHFGETEGRIAALLFALWPLAIQFTTVLASEIHFIALTLLALMAWDRAVKAPGWARALLWGLAAGLAFAAATYVRPIALLLPAILALAVLLRRPRASLRPILLAALATSIVFAAVSPWSDRNERVFGERVFMSTNFWPNFWMGNNPGSDGEYMRLPREIWGLGEIERAERLKKISVADLKEDPGAFVKRTLWKAVILHHRETIGVAWNQAGIHALVGRNGATALKYASTGWWYAMLLCALAGAVLLVRRYGVWGALLSMPVWLWGYFTGVHAVIVVGDRYHMPSIPFIALLAAVALAALCRRAAERPRRAAPLSPT